jgi:hypothetical protein
VEKEMTDGERPSQIGQRMRDGTVYAGSFNSNAIYTTPADEPLTYASIAIAIRVR